MAVEAAVVEILKAEKALANCHFAFQPIDLHVTRRELEHASRVANGKGKCGKDMSIGNRTTLTVCAACGPMDGH